MIAQVLLVQGEVAEALAELEYEPSELGRLIVQASAYHAAGRAADSDAALAELLETQSDGWAFTITGTLAFCGKTDRAFEWLGRAAEYGEPLLGVLPFEPMFDNLHGDPRWRPFLSRVGSAPDQLDAIEFDVARPG